jgi:hypothetical protein
VASPLAEALAVRCALWGEAYLVRSFLTFLLVISVGSLAMFALYGLIDIRQSLVGVALLGGLAAAIGWLVGRTGAIAAPLAFYVGVMGWPSVVHMYCAPEGCTPTPPEAYVTLLAYYWPFLAYVTLMGLVGSLIRARAWRALPRFAQ